MAPMFAGDSERAAVRSGGGRVTLPVTQDDFTGKQAPRSGLTPPLPHPTQLPVSADARVPAQRRS